MLINGVAQWEPDDGERIEEQTVGGLLRWAAAQAPDDVALVAGKTGPMVISIFTYDNQDQSWTVDNSAEVLIAKLAKAIVDAWSPEGLDAKEMVPGLGLEGK